MTPPLPAALATQIVLVVKQAATTPTFDAGSEDYGEYLIDLFLATVKTGDKSTIPALISLGAIGTNGGVASFVASGGPAILPALDAWQRTAPSDAGAVLEVEALMYAQQSPILTAADSAALISRILSAVSSDAVSARVELPYLTLRAPLPELVPLLRMMATTDTVRLLPEGIFPVRREAQVAADSLSVAWAALTPTQLLAALTREQSAACVGASGALYGHCQSMGAHLDDIAKHLGKGNAQPVLSAIKNFRKALQQAAGSGLASSTVQLLDANAAQLATLVGG
jgi:hypothetical protein